MIRPKCSKHGVLDKRNVLIWSNSANSPKWCKYCYDDLITKLIKDNLDTLLEEVEVDDDYFQNKD